MANTPWTAKCGDVHQSEIDEHGHTMIGEFDLHEHAEHAVHCVNNHEALVKALRQIELQADANSCGFATKAQLENLVRSFRHQARRAIAAAK